MIKEGIFLFPSFIRIDLKFENAVVLIQPELKDAINLTEDGDRG